MKSERTVPIGSLGEQTNWKLVSDYEPGKYGKTCPHVKDGKCPLVAIVETQCGNDATELCVNCLLNALEYPFPPMPVDWIELGRHHHGQIGRITVTAVQFTNVAAREIKIFNASCHRNDSGWVIEPGSGTQLTRDQFAQIHECWEGKISRREDRCKEETP